MADTTTNLTRLRVDARVDRNDFRIRLHELVFARELQQPVRLREIDLVPPASGPEVELRYEVTVGEIGRIDRLVDEAEQKVRETLINAGVMAVFAIRARPPVWS